MLSTHRGLVDARASQGTLRHGARCVNTLRGQRQCVSRRARRDPVSKGSIVQRPGRFDIFGLDYYYYYYYDDDYYDYSFYYYYYYYYYYYCCY
jgi:hypothetical protein